MDEGQEALLNKHGWMVECYSPFEIRHEETGSFATLWAAEMVVEAIEREHREETYYDRFKESQQKHENCPELTENDTLKRAADLHLKFKCELNELIKGYTFSECRELYKTCDLAKGNNCPAHMYYVMPEIKESLLNIMQWHQFNKNVHGIELT